MNPKRNKGRVDDRVVNVDPMSDSSEAGSSLPPPPAARITGGGNVLSASKAGASQAWANYRRLLQVSFNRMNRFQQELLINRLCMIVTIGVTLLALLIFYHLMPRAIRVILVPIVVVGGWWAANNVITPAAVARLENILARPEPQDDIGGS